MNYVTVDTAMLEKLHGLSSPLVFCDENGRVLGHFSPDDLAPDISQDELDRRAAEFHGRPLTDLMEQWKERT